MEHSRLLKYILPKGNIYKTEMASKINFEYENPNDIEAEVPSAQKIRSINNENGECELPQENTATPFSTMVRQVVDGRKKSNSNLNGEKDSKYDEKKIKTKIPVSRFRETVERVNTERRGSREKTHESHIPIRRSSIPKLNKTPPIKPVRKVITKIEVQGTTATEDEFDKLYEEVVCNTPTPVNIDVSLLNPKVDDPEKVENKFEEIIHDYDENKVQPIDVEKIKRSRIPFLKRKSLQDIDVQGDRSSKIITARDKIRLRHNSLKSDDLSYKEVQLGDTIIDKVNDDLKESSPKLEIKSQFTTTTITSRVNEDEATKVLSISTVTEVKTVGDKVEQKGQIIEENIYKDSVKVGIPVFDSYVDELLEDSNISQPVEVVSVLTYTSHNGDFDIDKIEAKSEIIDLNDNETSSEVLDNNRKVVEKIDISQSYDSIKPEEENQKELRDTKVVNKEKDGNIEDIAKLKGKVGRLISKNDLPYNTDARIIDINNEFPKKKSVLSKIAMFERNEPAPDVKSKIPKKGTKLPKLLTTNSLRSEQIHVHTPLIVEEIFKPFQAITDHNDNVEKVEFPKNKDDEHIIQTVRAEMMIIEAPETVHYEEENKVQIESNSLFIEHSEVLEEVLTPMLIESNDKEKTNINHKTEAQDVDNDLTQVLRKFESKDEVITNKNDETDTFKDKNKDIPVVIPTFVPVREVLKRYESLNAHETRTNKTIDIPKIRPISEIVNELKPKENIRSFDSLFSHPARQISELLSDLNHPEIHKDEIENEVFETIDDEYNYKNDIKVAEETKHDIKPDDTKTFINEKNEYNDLKHPKLKSFKSKGFEYKTLESRDDNFKSLQFIQDYVKSKDENNRRAKSYAELDLGDAVKGKVNRMIVRINSIEKVDVRTPISAKELPRKRSVSEKIALFERKLIPAKEAEPETTTEPEPQTPQPEELPAEIQERIEELSNAKMKYGKMAMPVIELANGVKMPVLAVGTALLDPRLVYHIITAAIDLGYRAIDTAYIYGNEKTIGEAIRAKINDGTVKREDLFIISKLWSTFHRTDLVKAACEASLEAMGLEYFDLYLIHNPMSFKEGGSPIPTIASVLQYSEYDYLDAWFGMETLGAKAKALGVSNFNSAQVRHVVDRARIKPVVNQVECQPYHSQQKLDHFCSELKITLSCFGVLGSKGTPLEFKSSQSAVIDDALVQVMASGLNVSPAQLLIRYQIQSGHNVVVKASSAAHLWDNLQALTFNLTSIQIDALHSLNRNKRTFTFKGMGDTHKNYPFKILF